MSSPAPYETLIRATLADSQMIFAARDPDLPVEPWKVLLYHPSGIIPPEHDMEDERGVLTARRHGNCLCNAQGPIPDNVPDWAADDDYDDYED